MTKHARKFKMPNETTADRMSKRRASVMVPKRVPHDRWDASKLVSPTPRKPTLAELDEECDCGCGFIPLRDMPKGRR